MPVLGIRMNKLEASRNPTVVPEGPIRIAPSQRILDIKENQINSVSGKAKIIEIDFEFNVIYDPPVGDIRLNGTVIYQATEDIRKKIIKTWKDKKRIAPEVEKEIIANLTSRAFLIAMNCAREIGVPSPMPFSFSEK